MSLPFYAFLSPWGTGKINSFGSQIPRECSLLNLPITVSLTNTSLTPQSNPWKMIRNLNSPEHLKMFLWRIGVNVLLTRENLMKRFDEARFLLCSLWWWSWIGLSYFLHFSCSKSLMAISLLRLQSRWGPYPIFWRYHQASSQTSSIHLPKQWIMESLPQHGSYARWNVEYTWLSSFSWRQSRYTSGNTANSVQTCRVFKDSSPQYLHHTSTLSFELETTTPPSSTALRSTMKLHILVSKLP